MKKMSEFFSMIDLTTHEELEKVHQEALGVWKCMGWDTATFRRFQPEAVQPISLGYDPGPNSYSFIDSLEKIRQVGDPEEFPANWGKI